MAQQCPECGAAITDAPWCGSCGARLGVADGLVQPPEDHRGRRIALAVGVLASAVALAVATGGDAPTAPPPEPVVPVDEAEVLPPTLPGAAVARQFPVEASILWERADLPGSGDPARVLVADGTTVGLLADDDPVLTVDAVSGEDVTRAVPTVSDQDLTFGPAGDAVTVEVGTATVRGVRDAAVRWEVELESSLAAAPIRTGTSLVFAMDNGDVVALDPIRGEERWRRDFGVLPTALAGDGTVLLVGTEDGRVLRLDPSGTPVTTVDLGEGPVLALAGGRPAAALLEDRLVGLDVTG